MDDLDSFSSFTLFGGMGAVAINYEVEIKKIHSADGLGLLDEDEERALRQVVGFVPHHHSFHLVLSALA